MGNHASADKAARQSIRRNQENLRTRSQYKTAVKRLKTALTAKVENKADAKKQALTLLNEAQRQLMKAASKKVIKKETASRHVARLSLAIHRTLGA
jgi:small subunit ribosomal protein S20